MTIFRLPILVRAAWLAVAVLAAGSAVRANSIQWNLISLGGVQEGGKNLEIAISVTNTGGDTWSGAHNLVMRAPNGDAMAMAGVEGVEPGQTVTTTIVWGIPEAGGTFAFTVEALEHEVEYFSVGGSYSINAPPAPPYTGIALAPLTFDMVSRPTISSTDVQPGWPTYRLRAKVIDGSQYGWHMAEDWNRNNYVVNSTPPMGNYAVTALYWVKYASLGGAVTAIGPERRESITVRDTVWLMGGAPTAESFHTLTPPLVRTGENLGSGYRLFATFRNGSEAWETAGESGNNSVRLKWLPPVGTYAVGLRWKRYDAAMNLIETSPEKIVPAVTITGEIWSGLDVPDGGTEEIESSDWQGEPYWTTSTSLHDFSIRVPGTVNIALSAGFGGELRDGQGNRIGFVPGVFALTAVGTYSVELSGGPGPFQLSGSFSTTYSLPQITSAATAPAGAVGTVFPGYTVTASGTGSLTFSAPPADVAGGLPPGLSLNPTTGAITGTPTQGGTYRTWISAENTGGRGGKWVTFAIKTLPIIPLVGETKPNGDLKLTVTAAMLPTAAQPPSAGMPAPTGALQYSGKWISHDPASPGERPANVPAHLPMYPNPWGTLQVTATYAGDANYLPATKTVEFKVVDTLPPDLGANVGFSVGSKTSTGFSLSWQPVSDLSGAIIGRPSQGVTYQASLDNGPATASFSVPGKDFNGLTPGTSHTVRIRAIDQWGNTSGWSSPFALDLPSSSASPAAGTTTWADVNGDGLPDEVVPSGDRFVVSEVQAYTETLTYNDWVQDIVQLPGSWQYVDTVRRFKSSDGTVIRWIEPEWQFVPGDQIPVWTTESTTVEVEMVVPTYEFVAEGGDKHEIVQVITTTDGKTLYGRVAGDLIFGERGAGPLSVFWTKGTTVAALAMQAFPTKLARLGTPPTGTQVAIPGLPGGGNIEVHAGTSGVSGTMTLPNGITIRAGGGSAKVSVKGSAGEIVIDSNGTVSGNPTLPGGWTVGASSGGNVTITGPDGASLRVGSSGTTLSLPNGAGITVSNTGAISMSLPAGLGAAIGGVLDDLGRVLGMPPGTAVRRAVIPQGPSNAPVIWENGDGGLANLPPGNYSVGSSPDNRTEADGVTYRTPEPRTVVWIAVEVRNIPPQIVAQESQVGRIGDYVASSLPSGMRHFVTAKSTPEIPDSEAIFSVVGIAASEIGLGKAYYWEGGIPSGSDPAKRVVSRDSARMEDLKLVRTIDGQVVGRLRVWVVWTTIEATQGVGNFSHDTSQPGSRWALGATSSVRFLFNILPSNIVNSQAGPDSDRPALGGTANRPAPGQRPGNWHAINVLKLADSAPRKWDLSRRAKITIRNPNNIVGLNNPEAFYINQPIAVSVPIDFPSNAAEGNDDPVREEEGTNPYAAFQDFPLTHSIGQMASFDTPGFIIFNSYGIEGREFAIEADFQEFARLQIWDGTRSGGLFWFRISNYSAWNHRFRARFSSGVWINNGSGHAIIGEVP